ncbi:MAG: methyltransferase domain-containing protein [Lachnospiraceae bacterium]|nr:methyltransferase domain-containing protein [Lachnospiraceae bacterium]
MFNKSDKNPKLNMSFDFNEIFQDELLHIDTLGRDERYSNINRYPYQPTPYVILDKIIESGTLDNSRHLVDFGCGKGRVAFYLADRFDNIEITGIEEVKEFYHDAIKNRNKFAKKDMVHFINKSAEHYTVPTNADTFFFFRPFSISTMKQVIDNIFSSYIKNPRSIKLIFYYLTEEYIMFLSSIAGMTLTADIDCRDIMQKDDKRFRIFVYESSS